MYIVDAIRFFIRFRTIFMCMDLGSWQKKNVGNQTEWKLLHLCAWREGELK